MVGFGAIVDHNYLELPSIIWVDYSCANVDDLLNH